MKLVVLADWCHQWLSERRFVAKSFSVDACVCWLFSVFLRCGHCKYLYVSEQHYANVTGWIFFSSSFEWLSGIASLCSVLEHGNFWAQTFHKVVQRRTWCGGISNHLLSDIIAKSVGERILKIDQHLAELEARVDLHLFPDTMQLLDDRVF